LRILVKLRVYFSSSEYWLSAYERW